MKPILFNEKMVQAILAGRKTQTRRVIKPQPSNNAILEYDQWYGILQSKYTAYYRFSPYCYHDILYVRETWIFNNNPKSNDFGKYEYRADYIGSMCDDLIKWRPSIHMPKEAARIFLRVTDVRVERLQDMTEDDAHAEGTQGCPWTHVVYQYDPPEQCWNTDDCPVNNWYCEHSLQDIFGRDIWDAIYGDDPKHKWDANPFVWVFTFERIPREEATK